MNKEVKYSGYSAVPSDYECKDGELAMSLNLLQENGTLKIIRQPHPVKSILPFDCLCIHNADGVDYLVLYKVSENRVGEVYYLSKESDDLPSLLVSGFTQTPSVAIIGNTLILSDGGMTAYALYSVEKEKYIYLGNSLPEISISFALSHKLQTDESYTDSVTLSFPQGYSMDKVNKLLTVFSRPGREANRNSSNDTDSFFNNLSNAVIGFLNKMNVKAAEENKFIHPFMLRWALRMFDGSYIHQSAPILLVPNSAMPTLKYTLSEEESLLKIQLTTILRRCTLMFKPTGLSEIARWTDIVKSIDFFVSLPVYIYDQTGSVEAAHRSVEDNAIFSHSGVPASISATRAHSGNQRPPSILDSTSLPQYLFPDGNMESWASTSGPALLPPRFNRKHIESDITSISNFYLVASVPLTGQDAISDFEAFTPLDINDTALTTLSTRPTLPDDWRSHDIIHFKTAYPFNSRLALANLSSSIFPGFSLIDMGQYYLDPSAVDSQCTLWVKIIRNSKPHWISQSSVLAGHRLPRFLFYPDPSAVEMRIICADGSGWKLPLKTHDFLNGSYWFDGLTNQRTPKQTLIESPIPISTTTNDRSKIFLSEVNNPFYFPVENRTTVGIGQVIGISSAAKALSQGQFGQFPLYAFTSDGVWALEIGVTGTFTARQPFTRDVCINPYGITQIDSAVLFPTHRGIMLLSGSQTQCITDTINNEEKIDFNSLPGFSTLLESIDSSLARWNGVIAPFKDFLANCGILYDYVHQRIVVFNPGFTYAYVYSLKSQAWGMMYSDIKATINSYPEALAVNVDGHLVDFTKEKIDNDTREMSVPCLLVTRPLKLDVPDFLKTVTTVFQRGYFATGHVSSVLYGSRNLTDWYLIRSSKEEFLRGFRGTPYKYFRLVLLCRLDDGENIFGASIEFQPRLTNKMR